MSKRTELINSVLTRYYYYWALGVFVVIGFIFWQFLLVRQYDVLQTSGVLRHSQLLETIATREQYLRDLQSMKLNFVALDHRLLRDLPVVLPSDYVTADVFSEIEQVFSGTGLVVRSVNISTLSTATTTLEDTEVPQDIQPGEARLADASTVGLNDIYEIVSITVNASIETPPGTDEAEARLSYSDFKTVLHHIEQQRHLMNLEQIVYSPTANNLTLILKTYQQVTHPNER